MPLKIQNYGEWEGDKPGGHHPPACSCHNCNEGRRTQDTAIGGQRAAAAIRQVEEVLRKPTQPVASPQRPLTRPAPRALAQRNRAVRRVMAAALRYSVGAARSWGRGTGDLRANSRRNSGSRTSLGQGGGRLRWGVAVFRLRPAGPEG